MASVKTYLLAPNFQYKLSGPIQLGNIIANPLRPTRPLSTLPENKAPAVETVTEYNHDLTDTKGHGLSLGVFARFLMVTGIKMPVLERSKEKLQGYHIEKLETRYINPEPAHVDAELARRIAEDRVQASVNAGLFGKQAVYMITGVKIATGLHARVEPREKISAGPKITVSLGGNADLGLNVAAHCRNESKTEFEAGEEPIVFAYQLHKIEPHKRAPNAAIDVFAPKAAFLHGSDEDADDSIWSVSPVTLDDLKGDRDEEEDGFESQEIVHDNGMCCTCVWEKDTM